MAYGKAKVEANHLGWMGAPTLGAHENSTEAIPHVEVYLFRI